MDVDDAEVAAGVVGDDELSDGVVAHHLECVDGVFGVEDGAGVGVHDVGGYLGAVAGLHHAAEVAVGDDAADFVALDDNGAAEALGGHLDDGVGDGGVGCHHGAFVLDVEVGDAEVELLAEGSAGMEAGEVACGEVAAFDESHGEGVAHDELGGGGGGGCEVVGAGLVLDGGVEDDVGFMGEEGVGVADDSYETVAEVFDERHKDLDFGGVAGFGDADDDVARADHAEVAVDGVGGVEEEGRGAGGVEGRDYLDSDVGAFADTGDDNAAGGGKNGLDGFGKGVVDIVAEIFDGIFFVYNHLVCNSFYFFSAFHCEIFLQIHFF